MSGKEIPKLLLDVLACPKCKGDLLYKREENRLVCGRCRLAYRVDEGIPIMLIEKAEKIE